jgi:hypothetical protein
MSTALLLSIIAQTGLLVWLDARSRRAWVVFGDRLDAMIARLDLLDARLAASDAKKNGGDHVAAGHPHLIEFRQ